MKDNRFKAPISVQLILTKESSVLLLRTFNTGYADGHYCLPAGHVEENEEAKEAMIREAKEEIGIELIKDNLELVHVLHRKAVGITYIDFIFKATEWNGEIKLMEPDKCDEIRWVSLSDLPSNIIPFTKKLLETQDMYILYGWTEYEQKLDEEQHMNSDTDEREKYTLRECKYSDVDFILELKRLGLKWYIEEIYGWDDAVQREKTIKELEENINNMKIIVIDGIDVGLTTFIRDEIVYCIGLTLIHPKYQNKKIATTILSSYIQVAKQDRKRIIIKTYKENPAKRLYERLGFEIYKTDDTHVHLEMDFSK